MTVKLKALGLNKLKNVLLTVAHFTQLDQSGEINEY